MEAWLPALTSANGVRNESCLFWSTNGKAALVGFNLPSLELAVDEVHLSAIEKCAAQCVGWQSGVSRPPFSNVRITLSFHSDFPLAKHKIYRMSTALVSSFADFADIFPKKCNLIGKSMYSRFEDPPSGRGLRRCASASSPPPPTSPTCSTTSSTLSCLLDVSLHNLNNNNNSMLHNHQQQQHRKLDRSMSEPVDQRVVGLGRSASLAGGNNSSRYKTELCRPFEESGLCKYGDKCQFAHGQQELRSLARHPKYKTELCRTFHTIGFCPYGPRCHFIHNRNESRRPKAVATSSLVGTACQDLASSSSSTSSLSSESLASDLDSLSLSGSPPTCASPLDVSRGLQLPFFNFCSHSDD